MTRLCCSLFVDARLAAEDPLRAANAYENMTAAIFRASEASDEATAAVRNASISVSATCRASAVLPLDPRIVLVAYVFINHESSSHYSHHAC